MIYLFLKRILGYFSFRFSPCLSRKPLSEEGSYSDVCRDSEIPPTGELNAPSESPNGMLTHILKLMLRG